MPAAPHIDVPTRPRDVPPAGPPTDPPHEPRGDRPGRRAVLGVSAVIALLLAIGGGVVVQQVRSADDAAAQRAATAEFAGEVENVRAAVADPARAGQGAATALLRHQLLVLAGEGPDASVGERLVTELRAAADDLEAAADTRAPEAPDVVAEETTGPVLEHLAGLEEQARDVAGAFRTSADDAEAWLAAVRGVDAAALAYADTTEGLPDGDDPERIAQVWRAERALLDDYAAALEPAAEHEAGAPLADAHRQLIDGMRAVADDAVTALEAEDIDGYNALLDERLGGEDPFAFGATLDEARAQVADVTIEGPLEDARGRALGLLTELEELRRATPPRLAEVA